MGESSAETARLVAESAAHLRHHRALLLDEWIRHVIDAELLAALGRDEVSAHLAPVYDAFLNALESGTKLPLAASVRGLLERARPRIETHEVVGVMLLLHDVVAPALLARARDGINALVDVPELTASRLAVAVVADVVREQERALREEREAVRDLPTPLLPVRDRLFVLPLIGVLDPRRARQLAEQVLRGVRANRAKVVVIDMTGVPLLDAAAASQLVQTIEAARLLGARAILSGLSAELAHHLVGLGVDLSHVTTVVDLQAGLEEVDAPMGSRPAPGRGGTRSE